MPPTRTNPSSAQKTKYTSRVKENVPKKPKKYSRPSYLYLTLMMICRLSEGVEDFTIEQAIDQAFAWSETCKHTLGTNARRSMEDYTLVFRHYGYIHEVEFNPGDDCEDEPIRFRTQDSAKELTHVVKESMADMEDDFLNQHRAVFVALGTHLRQTVTPAQLREITDRYRNYKGQEKLIRENLTLKQQLAAANELASRVVLGTSDIVDAGPSNSVEGNVRPRPRPLGELVNDSLYVDDVVPPVQSQQVENMATPIRPGASLASMAYPSPNSLARPVAGSSANIVPGSPSRRPQGITTPPCSPGKAYPDDDESDDGMAVDNYLLSPADSFLAARQASIASFSTQTRKSRPSRDRLLATVKKLRKREAKLVKAKMGVQKELVKQRVQTKHHREAGKVKDQEISFVKQAYNSIRAMWDQHIQDSLSRISAFAPMT